MLNSTVRQLRSTQLQIVRRFHGLDFSASFKKGTQLLIVAIYGSSSLTSLASVPTNVRTHQSVSPSSVSTDLQKQGRVKKSSNPSALQSSTSSPKKWQENSAFKKTRRSTIFMPVNARPTFDIPVTYNRKVRKWIQYYQGPGKRWIERRIGRSHKYLPLMKKMLREKKLPEDLAYIAMIESGFSAHATSTADAVGHWQFIKTTANRYGLRTKWWLDERRDPEKSTRAAANYLADLYRMFNSWYLAAAAYNMGENGLKRLIRRYNSTNYWVLSKKRRFPRETREYIPKLMAAMLISKAPKLYGFKNIKPERPSSYDIVYVPGGFDLVNLAQFMREERSSLTKLNPELIKGFVPRTVHNHRIRVPKGTLAMVTRYLQKFH
ncbi:MAG: lytic transglycosylase domain-containing protein [Bdellovibrionales bacterium]|nr:lytic transglycosylase domain-containing protein [Bdellovibrionales bacterium]